MHTCYLCGRNGSADPLDNHHLFGGPLRPLSEALDLKVPLCHDRCHIFGPEAAHNNAAVMERLHKEGQRMAMERTGWSREEFALHFGKNYLDDSEIVGLADADDFVLLDEELFYDAPQHAY